MLRRTLTLLFLCLALALAKGPKKLPKPGFNLFSVEQDIQMGREYAQEIEKQFKVVNNKELTDYVNRIGKRLVERGGLQGYPFFFKVVHEDSINAFALPGGPMYVHTGLISAVDSEGELAGVLAHELSHVVLRHSTNQVSKQNMIQLPAMIAGMAAGGGMMGQLAQLGIGLGANSVLMKFSRGAESDSDLLGLHTMSKAGYDPLDMARMFEKLEAAAGGGNSKLQEFFSSHPNPGNRVKAMEQEVQYLPKRPISAPEGDLNRMKRVVQGLGPAPKRGQGGQGQAGGPSGGQGAGGAQGGNAPMPNIQVSQRMTQFRGGGIAFQHPEGWRVQQGQGGATIAPAEGVVNGGVGFGIMVGGGRSNSGRVDLRRDTEQLLRQFAQGNPGIRMDGQPQQVQVAGSPALVTRLTGASPFAGDRENNVVMTIDRGQSMYYLVFIAPASQWSRWEPVYQRVSQTIRFE
jgi:Zn-dependent protease with chaperone function